MNRFKLREIRAHLLNTVKFRASSILTRFFDFYRQTKLINSVRKNVRFIAQQKQIRPMSHGRVSYASVQVITSYGWFHMVRFMRGADQH